MPLDAFERQIIAKKEPLDEKIRDIAQKLLKNGTKDQAWQQQANSFITAFFWIHKASLHIFDSIGRRSVNAELTEALTFLSPFKVDWLTSFLETCQNFKQEDDELVWEAVKDLLDKRRRSMIAAKEKESPVRVSTKRFTDEAVSTSNKRGSREMSGPVSGSPANNRRLRRHTRSVSNHSGESPRDSIYGQRPQISSPEILERLPVADTLASPYISTTLFAILTQPKGKVISEFETLTELVAALQGATRAHRSLFENGILHRDVSVSNIIITPANKNNGLGGMLIGLDMAKDLRNTTESPRSDRTGTMEFMAWEIVNQEGERVVHSYYHDLQSFLWVLIWLCSQTAWKKPQFRGDEQQPSTNPCAAWWRSAREAGDGKMIALKFMNSRFDELLDRFPETMERLKDLCWLLRMVLGNIPHMTASEAYDQTDASYTDTLDKLKKK